MNKSVHEATIKENQPSKVLIELGSDQMNRFKIVKTSVI